MASSSSTPWTAAPRLPSSASTAPSRHDVSWGAVTVDPFSDQPELRFVELPRDSVTEPVDGLRVLGRYRRFGVSEGKLRYAEVSQKKPFILSSFTLDDDGSSWTLEHRVALSPLLPDENQEGENTPCIGVIDPLDASMMCLILGDHAISVDMDKSKVLALSLLDRGGGSVPPFTGFLQPCVLPPWLGATPIPAGGKKERAKGNTLADVLVRSGRD
ncbi:hypothetical protein QOZ80_5BG0417630 [Eleusine coracana subsp. coracana]|nr:hypothetical protein QOZ80_5BG0417630 [Eleusine coracana subsp. coracana]